MAATEFAIDGSWIDSDDLVESRLDSIDETQRDDLRTVLRYLFATNGPKSLEKDVKSRAEEHLSPVERFVLQWLYKRTDGKLRKHYGAHALAAVKKARYQCERCGYRDVRALNLEKVETDDEDHPAFNCICANCNTVAARAKEMEVVATDREMAAKAAEEARVAAEEVAQGAEAQTES